jgi:phospholipid transport system transporter-binding protein
MIRREGDRMLVSGPLTLAGITAVLREGSAVISQGVHTVDLGGVEELDSSALALLLAWLREAKQLKRELVFANLPQGLTTIARLYGVAELLPAVLPASPAHH